MPPIAASGGVSTHQNLNIGKLSAGKHQITILADADNAVADSNRSNNTLVKEIDILEAANLQVVSAKVTPLQPKARDYVTVKATVQERVGSRCAKGGCVAGELVDADDCLGAE